MPATDRENRALACFVVQSDSPCAKLVGRENTTVSLPPAFQPVTLTVDEAATIRQLLDDPARPARAGQEMPTADASFLLDRDH